MANRPDDFPENVKKTVAGRAGHRCSFPFCGQLTSGPAQLDETKSINNGCAAHITAASPGGARYDESMSSEERRSISNAIWMCRHHGDLIDKEYDAYTVEQIKEWKRAAESRALKDLEITADKPEYTARDIRALEETCKIFTYDAVRRLKNEIFGSSVERVVIEPVNWYIAEADAPKYSFNNNHLQQLKLKLMEQCEKFSHHFGQQCGGGIGDRFSFVLMSSIRFSSPQSERAMEQYVYKTQDLARELSNTALEFLNIKENIT